MRRSRRLLLALIIAGAVLAIGVRAGVPWYVNSGRAAPRIERYLRHRFGVTTALSGLRMPAWLAVTADRVDVEFPGGWRAAGEGLHIRTTVGGLLRRHVVAAGATRVLVRVPETRPPTPSPDTSKPPGSVRLPTIGSLAVDALRIERGQAVLATATVQSRLDANARATLSFTLEAPPLALHAEGTATLDAARGRLLAADARYAADWARVLALAPSADAEGTGEIAGTLTATGGQLTITAEIPSARWGRLTAGGTTLHARTSTAGVALSEPVSLDATLDGLTVAGEPAALATLPGPVRIRAPITFDSRERSIALGPTTITWGDGAAVHASAALAWRTSGVEGEWDVRVEPLPVAAWAEYAPSLARLIRTAAEVGGSLGFEASGTLRGPVQEVRCAGRWSDGSVMVSDFRQAAGTSLSWDGRASRDQSGAWDFQLDGEVGEAELLWDAYYQSFSGRRFPFEAEANLGASGTSLEWRAALDLQEFGAWTAGSTLDMAAPSMDGLRIAGRNLDVQALVRDVLVPSLAEARPWTEDLTGSGNARIDLHVAASPKGSQFTGAVQLAGVSLDDPTDRLGVRDLHADVPFRMGPGAQPDAAHPPRGGHVRFSGAQLGPVPLDGAEVPVQVWDNAAVIGAPYRTRLFGGELTVDAMWGVGLLTPQRDWQGEVTLTDIDLAKASAAFGTIPLAGTLGGRFSRVHFAGGSLAADGAIDADVYSGALHLTHAGVLNVASPYRTWTADVSWDGIDLAEASAALQFGTVTGILGGYVRGLEVQAGQPAAFEAEFHTVPTPGVPQVLSIEAVNNIAVLGTGRGLGGIVSRGLTALFDEYKYEHIGFRCWLETDRFRIRGGARGPEGEYFVRGTMLPPTINVIHRNPDRTIPFKEMLRRVRSVLPSTPPSVPGNAEGAGA